MSAPYLLLDFHISTYFNPENNDVAKQLPDAKEVVDYLSADFLDGVLKGLGLKEDKDVFFVRQAGKGFYAGAHDEKKLTEFIQLWPILIRQYAPNLLYKWIMHTPEGTYRSGDNLTFGSISRNLQPSKTIAETILIDRNNKPRKNNFSIDDKGATVNQNDILKKLVEAYQAVAKINSFNTPLLTTCLTSHTSASYEKRLPHDKTVNSKSDGWAVCEGMPLKYWSDFSHNDYDRGCVLEGEWVIDEYSSINLHKRNNWWSLTTYIEKPDSPHDVLYQDQMFLSKIEDKERKYLKYRFYYNKRDIDYFGDGDIVYTKSFELSFIRFLGFFKSQN